MARPERNNVDYFPFYCKEGKAMYYIEQTYGNDGYAAWIKILRQLSVTNYHYLNLSDKVELMYLSSRCKISTETLSNLIKDLCDLGEFDKELWSEYSIIFSEKLVNSIKDAYLKRNNKCISLDSLLLLLDSLGVRKLSKVKNNTPINTQSRVEKTREDKSITKVEETLSIDATKFISYFNSKANRSFRVTERVKTALKARVRNYSNLDIKKAIDNAHLDKYHLETNFKYLTPEFILREEKLEKFINQNANSNSSQGVTVQGVIS